MSKLMTCVMLFTSIPRAAMSVATSTRVWPAMKSFKARWRAFCALLPWKAAELMPAMPRRSATRSAPRLVRVKTMTRSHAGSARIVCRRLCFSAERTIITFWSMRSTTICFDDKSMRNGSCRISYANFLISGGIVAENNAVRRFIGISDTILLMSRMKPMSNMRSASSSTSVWTPERSHERILT